MHGGPGPPRRVRSHSRGRAGRPSAAAGVDNATFCEPDEVPADLRFATIWSNPPIHVGKPALHALLERWLPRLADDGVAHLVVQRHLGADSLATWLGGEGWSVERVASRQGYRVLAVAR